VDELDEVPYQPAAEHSSNSQWALNRNYVSKELSTPSFAAKHIADLKFDVYSILVIQEYFKKVLTYPYNYVDHH